MAHAIHLPERKRRVATTYRILVRVRADNDLFTEWVEVGHHHSDRRALPALNEWLHENEPVTGTYRAESTRDGYYAELTWWGVQ